MASFDLAIDGLLKAEGDGEISNDPNDSGGLSKFGISQKYNPTLSVVNLTRDNAVDYYKKEWWLDIYNQIHDQPIANKIFNLSPNMGSKWIHVCAQRAIRAVKGIALNEDGIMGIATVTQINSCNSIVFLAALKSEAAGHYRQINNPAFIKGWLSRAYS